MPAPRTSRPLRADRPIGAALRDPLKAIRTLRQLSTTGIVLRVDEPPPDSDVSAVTPLLVSGWSLSRHRRIDRVEILVDGRSLGDAPLRDERVDVANAYPGVESAMQSGFHRRLMIDEVEPGSHELIVRATDAAGHTETDRRRISVHAGYGSATPGRHGRSTSPVHDQPAYVFIHIPKTAGTSIRQLLETVVPREERAYLYRNAPGIGMTEEQFGRLPADERAHIRLVFGHFKFGVHALLPRSARYLTMLRDPVDRVISQYYHHLTHPTSAHHQRFTAGQVTLQRYIEERSPGVDNHMTRQIAGLVRATRRGEEDRMLDVALRNLEDHFEAVLIMEEMASSVKLLGAILGVGLPDAPTLNRNRKRPARERIDPETRARIAESNRLDLALYAHAKARFDARLAKIG